MAFPMLLAAKSTKAKNFAKEYSHDSFQTKQPQWIRQQIRAMTIFKLDYIKEYTMAPIPDFCPKHHGTYASVSLRCHPGRKQD